MRGEGILRGGTKLRFEGKIRRKAIWWRGFERSILGGGEIGGVLRGNTVEGKFKGSNFGGW
jgi:hypothetical protein